MKKIYSIFIVLLIIISSYSIAFAIPKAPLTNTETISVASNTNFSYSSFYNKPTFNVILLNSLNNSYFVNSPGDLFAPISGEYIASFKYSGISDLSSSIDVSIYKNDSYPIATNRIQNSESGYSGIVYTGPFGMIIGDKLSVNINVNAMFVTATFYKYNPGIYEDSLIFSLTRIK